MPTEGDTLDTFGKDVPLGLLGNQYCWAYINAANTQLSLLVRGISQGGICPSAADNMRISAALDELTLQVIMLRHLLAERNKLHNQC